MSDDKTQIDALLYVQEQIADASSLATLAKLLSTGLDWEKGEVFTLFPVDVPRRIIPGFRDALPRSFFDTALWLAEHLLSYLQADDNPLVLFPNLTLAASSPKISSLSNVWSYGNEVYHVLLAGKHDLQYLDTVQRQAANAWLEICVISRLEHPSDGSPRTAVTRDELQRIALAAQGVIVSAYDGEGYLFWKRGGN